MVPKKKVLIIRLSSLGDILQALAATDLLRASLPDAQVHWLTKSQYSEIPALHPGVDQVIPFDASGGLVGLFRLGLSLRAQGYDLVYDAHNNLRSTILRLLLLDVPHRITRPKYRLKRLLLFWFGINRFPKPFVGADSFRSPLLEYFGPVTNNAPSKVYFRFPQAAAAKVESLLASCAKPWVALAPSAAWEMKRWPVKHWECLVASVKEGTCFLLGGKEDTFCERIRAAAPERTLNLAGELSLLESLCLVDRCDATISGDTGILHAADLFGRKGIALIGPTAFGYPKSTSIRVLEESLPCKPCSKDGSGRCSRSVYQQCMVDIRPERVQETLHAILK